MYLVFRQVSPITDDEKETKPQFWPSKAHDSGVHESLRYMARKVTRQCSFINFVIIYIKAHWQSHNCSRTVLNA